MIVDTLDTVNKVRAIYKNGVLLARETYTTDIDFSVFVAGTKTFQAKMP